MTYTKPCIYADVPDLSMIRVGKTYYMSSTTMHLSPGVPIMKSTDLVNWQLVSYAYDTLASTDALTLAHGKSAYGRGSWASSLRYHQGTYYVSTFAQTTGKTHVYATRNIEKGPWKAVSFAPSLHDHSLFLTTMAGCTWFTARQNPAGRAHRRCFGAEAWHHPARAHRECQCPGRPSHRPAC